MQNLQTKFPSTSPNIEYLSQFELLDQDQLIEDREEYYQSDFMQQNSTFQFEQHSTNLDDYTSSLNFQQFCQNILCSKQQKKQQKNSSLKFLLLKLTCLFFGQILEYLFIKTQIEQNHPKRLINILGKQYKIYLIFKLFGLFFLLYYFPIQTIILIGFLTFRNNNNQFESEVGSLNAYIREINQSFIELKIFNLQYISKNSLAKNEIESHLKQLIAQLEEQFNLSQKQNENLLDKLEALIFQITQGIKQKNLEQQFLDSNPIQIHFIFNQIKNVNSKLKYSINLIKSFPNKITKVENQFQQKNKKTSKQKQNQLYYFSLMAQEMKRLDSTIIHSQTQTKRLNSLIIILQKQIAFRKLYQYQKKMIADEKSPSEIQQRTQQQIIQFVAYQKPETVSVCFDNGNIEYYDPSDSSFIKEKLEMIWLEKERKQKEQRIKKQSQTSQEVLKFNIKDLKPQRISFGIGLIPPKRNLEAFYSD